MGPSPGMLEYNKSLAPLVSVAEAEGVLPGWGDEEVCKSVEDCLLSILLSRGLGEASMCLTISSSALVSRSGITGAGLGGEDCDSLAGLLLLVDCLCSLDPLLSGTGANTGCLLISVTTSNNSLGIPMGAELWDPSEPATDAGVSRSFFSVVAGVGCGGALLTAGGTNCCCSWLLRCCF